MAQIIILAGGKGTRMKSELPKVLQPVKGMPIILRLLDSVEEICPTPIIIVGHKAYDVIAATGNRYEYVEQKEQLGTGHAVLSAKEKLEHRAGIETVFVMPGDHPLISAKTIQSIINTHEKNKATITLGTFIVPNYEGQYSLFNGYGRVIREADGTVEKIVELKDASEEEKKVQEVNLSYYCFDTKWLWKNISSLATENAAKEYYLTDMVKIARDQNLAVVPYAVENFVECLGINTPEQLLMVEEAISSLEG